MLNRKKNRNAATQRPSAWLNAIFFNKFEYERRCHRRKKINKNEIVEKQPCFVAALVESPLKCVSFYACTLHTSCVKRLRCVFSATSAGRILMTAVPSLVVIVAASRFTVLSFYCFWCILIAWYFGWRNERMHSYLRPIFRSWGMRKHSIS